MIARLTCCGRPSIHRLAIRLAVMMAASAAVVFVLPADSPAAEPDSREVRGTARRVLQSPAFRNLKPLKRSGTRNFSGSGNGQAGGGNEGDRQPGNGQPGDGQGNDRNGEGRNGGRNGEGRFEEGGGRRNGGENGGRNGEFNGENGNGGRNPEPPVQPPPPSDASDRSFEASPPTGFGAAVLTVFQIIGWMVAAVVICAMVFLIVKGLIGLVAWFQDRERNLPTDTKTTVAVGDPLEPETSPGQLPADVYVGKARALAAAGRYREAVAQLLLGGMSHLERTGVVVFRQGLTHRDYVRNARSNPAYYQAMRTMVRVYEPLGFGRRSPSQSHFDDTLSAYETGFRHAAPI